eukprot:COSAG05_NODE_1_length_66591_cov_307.301581_44_plen_504_part_00
MSLGLGAPGALLKALDGAETASDGRMMDIRLNQLLKASHANVPGTSRGGGSTPRFRPVPVPRLRGLRGWLLGLPPENVTDDVLGAVGVQQAPSGPEMEVTLIDGCRLSGMRGLEWDAMPADPKLSTATLCRLLPAAADGKGKGQGKGGGKVRQLGKGGSGNRSLAESYRSNSCASVDSRTGRTVGDVSDGAESGGGASTDQASDVVYLEGTMPLVIAVPYAADGSAGPKDGGGSGWWGTGSTDDWDVQRKHEREPPPHGDTDSGGGCWLKLVAAIHAQALAATGRMPHIVICQLRRSWVDCTRRRSEGVDGLLSGEQTSAGCSGDPADGQRPSGARVARACCAWDNYHSLIEVAKARARSSSPVSLSAGTTQAPPQQPTEVALDHTPTLLVELGWTDVQNRATNELASTWALGYGLIGSALRTASGLASEHEKTGLDPRKANAKAAAKAFERFDVDGSQEIDANEVSLISTLSPSLSLVYPHPDFCLTFNCSSPPWRPPWACL